MWSRIASIILRNRLYILTIILLLTLFFGYFVVTDLRVDNRYGILLPKDHPTQMNYVKFKEQFGEDGATLVMAISSKDLYSEVKFKAWKELGDKILAQPGVETVISEATLFNIVNDTSEQKFVIHRIFYDTTFKEKSIDSIRGIIKRNPVYKNLLYNDSSKVSLMLIGLNEKVLEDKVKSKVVFRIEELTKKYEPTLGKFYFSGLPHIRVMMAKRIVSEMYFFLTLSLAASFLLLYYFYRSFKIVFMSGFVVLLSIVWALGMAALLNYPLTAMMALVPPLLVVIGIPNCIYIITRYHQEFLTLNNKTKALFVTVRRIGPITFMTNLTTSVGFVTFTSSDRLSEFGIIASINVMVVFILSLALIPILASYFGKPSQKHLKHLVKSSSKKLVDWLLNVVLTHRTRAYVIHAVLSLIGIIGAFYIVATGNVTGDIPAKDPIAKDLKYIEQNFGGSIPFEIIINYKKGIGLMNQDLMGKIESTQEILGRDTLFSKSISYVDLLKVINMSYHHGDPNYYKIPNKRSLLKLKDYLNNFNLSNLNNGRLTMKDLVDTTNRRIRIRSQMKDLGSYQVAQKVDSLKVLVDNVFNPEKKKWEFYLKQYDLGKKIYFDSLISEPKLANNFIDIICEKDPALTEKFNVYPESVYSYKTKKNTSEILAKSIQQELLDIHFTGVSVVVSEGTKYLVTNLIQSLVFAVIIISLLIYFLFKSIPIVIAAMVPNLVPLILTAGIMGIFQIPLKPSTLMVFGVALGITINDAILLMAKFKQEMKRFPYLSGNELMINALRESALGMAYTSIVLFFGFIMFVFSQFGGTQALGLLISITVLAGMFTNLILLPSLVLTYEKWITSRSFSEPYFEIFNEEIDYDTEKIQIEISKALGDEH
ncbi:MAG: hypothetical protein RL365_549 [Bacteroidota bacterium]|jgi:predicted RND superfamily exporter protein